MNSISVWTGNEVNKGSLETLSKARDNIVPTILKLHQVTLITVETRPNLWPLKKKALPTWRSHCLILMGRTSKCKSVRSHRKLLSRNVIAEEVLTIVIDNALLLGLVTNAHGAGVSMGTAILFQNVKHPDLP